VYDFLNCPRSTILFDWGFAGSERTCLMSIFSVKSKAILFINSEPLSARIALIFDLL
jgi:hypothetical protein